MTNEFFDNTLSASASVSFKKNDIRSGDVFFELDDSMKKSGGGGENMPVMITSIEDYINRMKRIRQRAFERKLVPLYHYTAPKVASMILQSGLRMSTQGQGDGGVYVSTQGPASYGLGSDEYEDNIIKDCFGVERIDEYRGKGKLDVIIVYGCAPDILQQVLRTTVLNSSYISYIYA
jgi:hypothetical protein